MANWWRAAASPLKSPNNRLFHTVQKIQAIPRELIGSKYSIRERDQGRIPTVIFSQRLTQTKPDDPTSVCANLSSSGKLLLTTEWRQIRELIKRVQPPFLYSTTVALQVRAGPGSSTLIQSGKVLPVKVQREEATGKVLSLECVWAEDGTTLKVDVPIVYKGEDTCPGIKKGGYLRKYRPFLKFLCPAESIPPKIEVDLSNLDIGDKIRMKDITVDSTLKLLSRNDTIPICRICSMEIKDDEAATVKDDEAAMEIKDHEIAK